LIPDWTYFRCPGATLLKLSLNEKIEEEQNRPQLGEEISFLWLLNELKRDEGL